MPKKKEMRKIAVDIHPVLFAQIDGIVKARREQGETCSISEIVRKSIILYLAEKNSYEHK